MVIFLLVTHTPTWTSLTQPIHLHNILTKLSIWVSLLSIALYYYLTVPKFGMCKALWNLNAQSVGGWQRCHFFRGGALVLLFFLLILVRLSIQAELPAQLYISNYNNVSGNSIPIQNLILHLINEENRGINTDFMHGSPKRQGFSLVETVPQMPDLCIERVATWRDQFSFGHVVTGSHFVWHPVFTHPFLGGTKWLLIANCRNSPNIRLCPMPYGAALKRDTCL